MSADSIEYNLASNLLRRCALEPARTAIIFEGKYTSFGEFEQLVRQQAAVLKTGGVCRGDRVAYLGHNHPAFFQTLFAAHMLGAIFVPLNFRLTAPELEFIVNDAGVHTLLVDDAFTETIDSIKASLCCRRYLGAQSSSSGWLALSAECRQAEPLQSCDSAQQGDVAIIMYTSGTTGRPKGAMLTHGNIVWNNINAMMTLGNGRDDRILTAAPLFHIGGLNVMTLNSFHLGSTVVLHRHFDPVKALDDIARYKITHMFGAPAMFLFMSQSDGFEASDLGSIKSIVCGAAPVPESLIELYGKRDVNFCQGYGLTETAPLSAFLTAEWAIKKLGSAGIPPLYCEAQIVGAGSTPLAVGERGEICLRGPNVMKGYWNRPEATAEAIDAQGWFHSGDIGYLDEDGFLYICDRLKDMVISGGENVYPAEVEGILYKHDDITEVAILGLPDEKWGEAVTAFVVLRQGAQMTLDSLRAWADSQLARYKLPLRLHIIEELPRNPAGKVLKYVLKEQFTDGQG